MAEDGDHPPLLPYEPAGRRRCSGWAALGWGLPAIGLLLVQMMLLVGGTISLMMAAAMLVGLLWYEGTTYSIALVLAGLACGVGALVLARLLLRIELPR